MRVTVLGPVRIVTDDSSHIVPRAQARGVLGLLALHHGQLVTIDAVVDSMWARTPPNTARGAIHSAISAIRSTLAKAGFARALESNRFGYRLLVETEDVDVGQLGRLTAAAKRQQDDTRAVQQWRQVLALFQGEPLADAVGDYILVSRRSLEEQRLAAVEELADAQLRLGRHVDVAAELLPMLAANSNRERLLSRVMLALHGSGRQAEALAHFNSYRKALAESDGLDPGRELAELAVRILRGSASAERLPLPVTG